MANSPISRRIKDPVDQIDINILAALFAQARLSKVQMSEDVGISAGRCCERMRRLERSGIVRGYHADIDIPRLTSSMQFLVQIKLTRDTAAHTQQFEKAVLKMSEVISCQSVLGHIDYVLVVVAASIERYQAIIAELRAQSTDDFDFVTFPISKIIKSAGQSDLRQIITRLGRREEAPV